MPNVPVPNNQQKNAPQTQPNNAPPPPAAHSSKEVPRTNPQTANAQVTQQKPRRSPSMLIGSLLLLLGILLFCGGILLLLRNRFQPIESNQVPTPRLADVESPTTDGTVTVRGSANPNSNVHLYINEQPTEYRAQSNENGDFSFNVVLNNEGSYQFNAAVVRTMLFPFRSSFSNSAFTTYDKTVPTVTFNEIPKSTDKGTLNITGKLSEKGSVTAEVNGKKYTAETDAQGNFTLSVPLKEGQNDITVTSTDQAKNATKPQKVSVSYNRGSVNGNGARSSRNGSNTRGTRTHSPRSTRGTLPNSSGPLEDALSALFGNVFITGAAILALLGYAASTSIVWLLKNYTK